MEHTKGKWEVGKVPPLSNWIVGVNLDDPMKMETVADLYGKEADAHLIAAAPELYDELEEADGVICELCYIVNPQHATADYGVGCKSCEDREKRLKVLLKAKGRN